MINNEAKTLMLFLELYLHLTSKILKADPLFVPDLCIWKNKDNCISFKHQSFFLLEDKLENNCDLHKVEFTPILPAIIYSN